MDYRIRDGIVMETICGTSLLIATLEATQHCPYVAQLNEASAYIWKMLFDNKSFEEMTVMISKDFDISEKEAADTLGGFLTQLKEQNYLVTE